MASSALVRSVVTPGSFLSGAASRTGHGLDARRPAVGPSFVAKPGLSKSNFLGTSVDSLASEKKSVQSAHAADRRRLSVEANLFKRAKRVVRSYTSAVKSSIEDPAKLLDDSLRDLDKERGKVQETLRQVQVSITQLEGRGKQAALRAEDWHGRARQAMEKGHEDLAREALRNQKEYEASMASLESQWKQQTTLFSKLESSGGLLEEKIEEARAKRNALAARAQTASANRRVQEILGSISTGGAVAKFEEVKEKVSKLEAEAEALAELTGDSLESRFRNLERSSVDKELTQLRAEVGSNTKRDEVTFKDRLALPDFLNLKRQSEEKSFEVIDAEELERTFGEPKFASEKQNELAKKEEQPWWEGRDRWSQPSTPGAGSLPSQGDWGDVSGRREGDPRLAFPWQRVAAFALQLAFGALVFGAGLGGSGPAPYNRGLPGGVVLGGPFIGRSGVIVRRVSPFGSPFGSPFDPLGMQMRPMRPSGGRMTRGGIPYRRIIIN